MQIYTAYRYVKSLDILCIAINTAVAYNKDLISTCYKIKTARDTETAMDTKIIIKYSFWKRLKYLFTNEI